MSHEDHRQVAVATLAFGEVPYLLYTEAINRRYCDRHGYEFVVMWAPMDVRRSPIWHKVAGVRQLLKTHEYVLFLDADAYFRRPQISLNELIASQLGEAVMLLGTDRRDKHFTWSDSSANCGVFLIRHCPEAFAILDDWWSVPLRLDARWLWRWPPEQGAFNEFVRCGPHGAAIKVVHYAHLNGADGPFIRHLIGFTEEERLEILRSEAARLDGCGGALRSAWRRVLSIFRR